MNTPTSQPSVTSSPHMLFKASWQDGTRSSTPTPKASPKPLGPTPTPCSRLAVLKPDRPRLWWLLPWSHARAWHSALWALKAYADRTDRALDLQTKVIEDQSKEIKTLRAQLQDSRSLHEIKNATIAGIAADRDNLLECGEDLADAVRRDKHVDWALEEWDKAKEVSR